MAIEVISGILDFSKGCIISNQDYLMKSYLSVITISDSIIHSIRVSQNHMRILTSNFTMNNIEIYNISTAEGGIFMTLAFESIFNAQNITYYDSYSILAQTSGSSQAFLNNITFRNITNANDLLKFRQCSKATISQIQIENWTTNTERIFLIDNSKQVLLSNISIQDYASTF